ncbi:unnamed protein product [Arctia plantaginis]|uniref:Geranylgeranyl transferase type-2 subunit alpha n=1 Tax=Arctia plantaginis TaxID=874455 RepID=A0A8S0ZEA6_ARCPL|nr:unnamed protein product [Arctia plantaginis]CAB3250045.1 unnamed protein product [Arctia plantaginis]
MHGRVKVRTTEEEKARKEKERQEKLKVFEHAMQKIQQKRKDAEYDKDLLDLTGKVLSSNPDIYTLWNIRREILKIFKKNNETEELPQQYDAELHLTEYCLKTNPKSYGAWHQREWVLTTRNDPDWQKELSLCNMYLKLDERNFHTWDYRRFVVSKCNPSLKDEFDFTTDKLYDNFSNYSAWHYRSKILVALYPDLEGGRPIEDIHHKQELKIVQSAAFTDPDDTSAWFYQRWLLGAVKTTTKVVVYVVTPVKITIAFNKYVEHKYVGSKIRIFCNNNLVKGEWFSCTKNQFDVLWILKHDTVITENDVIKMEYDMEDGNIQTILSVKLNTNTYVGKNEISFERKYSKPVVEELTTQLLACRQLLAMEPDNKWTLLTTTVFLHCIDAKQNHKEVIKNLHTLKTIDKLRAGYYDDLLTKWSIEDQLSMDYVNDSDCFKIMFKDKITSLPHLQYYSYCETVDLSNQNLTSNILPSLIILQHCKKLSLENNKLKTLSNLPNLNLEVINLKGNTELAQEVELFKKKCNYTVIY